MSSQNDDLNTKILSEETALTQNVKLEESSDTGFNFNGDLLLMNKKVLERLTKLIKKCAKSFFKSKISSLLKI